MASSFDRELAIDQLRMLEEGCERIKSRMSGISSSEDFDSAHGLAMLDSIAMVIIGIGEILKVMDRHVPEELFAKHPEVDWKRAKGMRDRLSHGYFFMDKRIVFQVASVLIPILHQAVTGMREDLERETSL